MGRFVVTVDDGSGSPSTALLSTIQDAVDAVRPVGSIFSVRPPTVIIADVSFTIQVAAATAKGPIAALVGRAVGSYINTLPIGVGLSLTRLAQIAYSASSAVINVSQLLVNGSPSDITPTASSVIKAGIIAVN
jgi:phage-related baseplate assembly protein